MWNSRRVKRVLTSLSAVTITTLGVSIADIIEDNHYEPVSFEIISRAYAEVKSELDKSGDKVVESNNKVQKNRPIPRPPAPQHHYGPPPKPIGGAPPPPRIAGHRQYTPSGEKKKDSAETRIQEIIKAHSIDSEAEIRTDGKAICNVLKEKRVELAALNNISFKSDMCPNTEPCAGTCPKCEAEAEYLKAQLKKLPKDQIVYPKLDVSDFR